MDKISFKKIILYLRSNILSFKNDAKFNLQGYGKIKNIKNSKKNKKVFIFGNGNSINLINPEKIKKLQNENYDLFAMNSYVSTEFGKIAVPNYYVITDDRVLFPQSKDYEKIGLINYEYAQTSLKILEKLSKEIKVFLPSYLAKNNLKNDFFIFNNNKNPFSNNFLDISKSNNLHPITGLNTIQICVYLGYEEIYLAGLDNDHWLTAKVDCNNQIWSKGKYFYEKENNLTKNSINNISNYLLVWSNIFNSYEKFKNFKITNLNPESLITSFNKKHNLDIYK
jgi:hypothetical protein